MRHINNKFSINTAMYSKTKGFSLIELMVGMALGLFVTTIAVTYLVSSSKTSRLQNDDSRIQENARFALDLLTSNIRLAGFNADNTQAINSFFAGAICPDGAGNGTATACTGDEIDVQSDRIAVELITRPGDGINAASNGNGCGGVNAGVNVRIANIFWVGGNALNCQTYDIDAGVLLGNTLPLISGVDAMQVQYGEDRDGDGDVDTYASYTNVAARGNMGRILSVRIALLTNSGLQRNDGDSDTRTYTLFDGPVISFTDRVIREIYSTTIKLPSAG